MKKNTTTITVSLKSVIESANVDMISFSPSIFFTVLKGLKILKALSADTPDAELLPPSDSLSKSFSFYITYDKTHQSSYNNNKIQNVPGIP